MHPLANALICVTGDNDFDNRRVEETVEIEKKKKKTCETHTADVVSVTVEQDYFL